MTSLWLTEACRVRPLGITNVCTKLNDNPFYSCWDFCEKSFILLKAGLLKIVSTSCPACILILNMFYTEPSSSQTAHSSHNAHYCMFPSVQRVP